MTVSEPVISEEIEITTESAEIESETVAQEEQVAEVYCPKNTRSYCRGGS